MEDILSPAEYGLNKKYRGSRGAKDVSPFELKAEDFRDFAEKDIQGDDRINIVNALSNIKRAIENRIDLIFYVLGYPKVAKKWNFPTKLSKLQSLKVIAPRILTKVTKIRNLLEHEYKLPEKEEVEDALDIMILFLETSKKYNMMMMHCNFLVNGKENKLEFNGKNNLIITLTTDDFKAKKFSINPKDNSEVYDDWAKLIVECMYCERY